MDRTTKKFKYSVWNIVSSVCSTGVWVNVMIHRSSKCKSFPCLCNRFAIYSCYFCCTRNSRTTVYRIASNLQQGCKNAVAHSHRATKNLRERFFYILYIMHMKYLWQSLYVCATKNLCALLTFTENFAPWPTLFHSETGVRVWNQLNPFFSPKWALFSPDDRMRTLQWLEDMFIILLDLL